MQKKRQREAAPFSPHQKFRYDKSIDCTGRLIAAAQKNKDPENISAASASVVISATDIEAAASTSVAETAAEAAVSTQTT